MREDLPQLVEALIFASPEPVALARLAEVIGDCETGEVESVIFGLNESYEREGHAFHIVRAAGGYRFATRAAFSQWVRKLLVGSGRVRLTRASLETLSLIAYRQPISKAEIESFRRVDAGGVLKMLLERRLIRITGKAKTAGRPLLYGTTTEFLKHFGIDALEDLPKSEFVGKEKPANDDETDLFAGGIAE